jgi:hypothetical protein
MTEILGTEAFTTWVCSVALLECGLGSASDVVEKSLFLLPVAPDSPALLALADPPGRQTYRDDFLTAIDSFLDDMNLSRVSELDWAWIALWSTFLPTSSIGEEVAQNRLRFDLQTHYSALFEYTVPFIAAQDDLADGADPTDVARSIRTEVGKVGPPFLRDFKLRFELGPGSWVLAALGGRSTRRARLLESSPPATLRSN